MISQNTRAMGYSALLTTENNLFHSVLPILEAICETKTGLGEVIHDYAEQSYAELKHIRKDEIQPPDSETLAHWGYTLKTVHYLLKLIPFAMERNHIHVMGKKGKITVQYVEAVAREFATSEVIQEILAEVNEDQVERAARIG